MPRILAILIKVRPATEKVSIVFGGGLAPPWSEGD